MRRRLAGPHKGDPADHRALRQVGKPAFALAGGAVGPVGQLVVEDAGLCMLYVRVFLEDRIKSIN